MVNALGVTWQGAGFDSTGPREHRAEVLPMMAFLFPDAMVDALMREVERMANGPMPHAERVKRVAASSEEIEQLQRVEEALGDRSRARACASGRGYPWREDRRYAA